MCFFSVTFISRYNSNEENFIRQRPNACPGQRNLQSPVRGRRCDSVETNIAKVHVKYGNLPLLFQTAPHHFVCMRLIGCVLLFYRLAVVEKVFGKDIFVMAAGIARRRERIGFHI